MYDHPISTLAKSLASAQYKDLPKVKDSRRKVGSKSFTGDRMNIASYNKWKESTYVTFEREHFENEIYIHSMTLQLWESTALGFGGMGIHGGSAMTDAYTIIIGSHVHDILCVYFGGIFAYSLDMKHNCIIKLNEDVAKYNVASVAEKDRYLV